MAFKFNNGLGAIICDGDNCAVILRSGVLPDDAPQDGEHLCRPCANKKLGISRFKPRKVS